ncbi:hypothetical protein L1887_29977 [Cichorium endivia]|nr:hypothetical protein L1887_29977 [Cichorium endivia]
MPAPKMLLGVRFDKSLPLTLRKIKKTVATEEKSYKDGGFFNVQQPDRKAKPNGPKYEGDPSISKSMKQAGEVGVIGEVAVAGDEW